MVILFLQLFYLVTEAYSQYTGKDVKDMRRWAYEIFSSFLFEKAVSFTQMSLAVFLNFHLHLFSYIYRYTYIYIYIYIYRYVFAGIAYFFMSCVWDNRTRLGTALFRVRLSQRHQELLIRAHLTYLLILADPG